jgi:hypothetical protein
MAKLPHQSSVPPVDGPDAATKDYADASGGAPVNALVVNTKSAYFYDASDQFASVADPDVYQGLAAITVECWFTIDRIDGGYYGLCGQSGISEVDVAFTLRVSNTNSITAVFSTDGGITSQSITFSHGAALGKWRHVAVTWDGATGNATAYMNGVLVSGPTALVAGTIHDSAAPFYIGRFDGTDFNYEHYGHISELRIWGVVRTVDQLIDSMYGVARGDEDGLVTVHHLSGDWRDTGPNAIAALTPDANAPTFVESLPFNEHTLGPSKGIGQNLQSYNFVGSTDDYLYRTNPGIYGGHPALSVECWLKPVSALVNYRGVVSHDDVFWIHAISSTQIVVAFSTNGTMSNHTITPGWTLNEWTHLACTWDGRTGQIRAYVDGVLTGGVGSGQQGVSHTNTNAFTVGIADGILEGWDGNISELRIWSTARSESQILDSMYGAMAGDEEGLLSLYHLNGDYRDSGPFNQLLSASGGNIPVISDEVPHGPVAKKLMHASGEIDGSAATAPTVGQVATAIDANTFNWQDPAGGGADADAVHVNVAGEIAALTEKVTPVAADHVLMEDSEAGNVKKRVLMSNMLGGSDGPLAAAQGDYLLAAMTLEHASVVGQPIEYDVPAQSRGGLALDVVNFKVTGLKAGRTYHLQAQARSRIDYFTAQFYDLTASNFVGKRAVYLKDNSNVNSSGMPVASYIFTPAVDTEIEFRVDSINSGSALANADGSWLSVIEIGAVQADVVGGLEFMDIITVAAPTASVSFGVSGDGAFSRALDGDVDQTYVLVSRVSKTSTMTTADMKPNGIGTNQVSRRVTMESSTATFPRLVIAQPGATGFESGTTEFDAVSGRQRSFHSEASLQAADVPTEGNQYGRTYTGTWNDTATNITSLEIATNDASAGIDAGSEFVLYRRTRTNLRADSAAVYERMAMETVDPGALVTTERTVGHSIYGGSLVGVSLRVEDAVTAGDITVNVKLDGVTALTAVLDTTNSTSRVVRAAVGTHKFAADKNISVEFVPSAYDNAGSLASAVTAQVHLTNDALINPPKNTQIESALWYPPEFAHAMDEEFDSGELPAGWSWLNTPVVTPIDPYADIPTGGPRVSYSTQRRSYLMMQPSNAEQAFLSKAYVPPTDVFMWSRMTFNYRNASPVENENNASFAFYSSSDYANNRVELYLQETDAGQMSVNPVVVDNSSVAINLETLNLVAGGVVGAQPFEYIGIQKIGSVYHFWAAPAGGHWVWIAKHTWTEVNTIDRVMIQCASPTVIADPGNAIAGVDFIRFVESATFLP